METAMQCLVRVCNERRSFLINEKRCIKCGETKDVSQIYKGNICKKCNGVYNAEYAKNHRPQRRSRDNKAHKARYKNDPVYRAKCKRKARENSIISKIELRDNYIINSRCGRGIDKELLRDNPELLETIKLIIKTKRLCRFQTSKN